MSPLRAGLALALAVCLAATPIAFAESAAPLSRGGDAADTKKAAPNVASSPAPAAVAKERAASGAPRGADDRDLFFLLLLGIERARTAVGGAGR